MAQRFLLARVYAGSRVSGRSAGWRLAHGVLAVALPPVLFTRILSRVWRSGAHRAELGRSLPLLMLFVFAWGLGELVGAWFGEGHALMKVS
jgi:hypothetical protein